MTTFSDFVAYVKERPPGRKIDHNEGWSECAVGDFIARIHRKGKNTYLHDDMSFDFANDHLPENIRDVLGDVRRVDHVIGTEHTYGELAKWLTLNGY